MARRIHATPEVVRGQEPHAGTSDHGRRRLRRLLALAMVLPALVALGGAPAQATGNHGTIKVHAAGSPDGTESNEPHVCAFNLEAFGFQEDFEGYVELDVQGGDGPTGVAAGPFEVGPADVDGFFATEYFNVAGGEVVADGHYKVTVYGKFNGAIDYQDVKAKSKVFKVDCPAPPPPPTPDKVTPAAPTPSDVCEPATGPTNDRITIPTDASFTYTLDGAPVAAGSVVATGTSHTVTAVAKPGVVVQPDATTQWTFTFTKVACVTPPPPPPAKATPAAATSSDVCEPATGPTNDRVTIPTDASFTYTLDGAPVAAGPVVATGTTHTVTAVAQPGVVVEEGAATQWTFTFTKVLCVTPPPPTTDVLGEEAGGSVGGGLHGTCQGTLRARMRNGFADPVRFTLRVGTSVTRYSVRGDTTRRVRTTAPGGARVVLRAQGEVIGRMRMPARCTLPEVLPSTGLRGTTAR